MRLIDIDTMPQTSVTDEDRRLLRKAKKIDEKRTSNGWRYVQINGITQVLVPFGADGNPTPQGRRIIGLHNEKFNIK